MSRNEPSHTRARSYDVTAQIDYHLQRARSERDIAYRSLVAPAADAHMRLSALHLGQGLLLQEHAPGGRDPAETEIESAPAVISLTR